MRRRKRIPYWRRLAWERSELGLKNGFRAEQPPPGPHIDDCGIVTPDDILPRSGLSAPRDPVAFQYWFHVQFSGSYDFYSQLVSFIDPIPAVVQISFEGSEGRLKPYFICPMLGQRCRALYYGDGRLGSSRALRVRRDKLARHPADRKKGRNPPRSRQPTRWIRMGAVVCSMADLRPGQKPRQLADDYRLRALGLNTGERGSASELLRERVGMPFTDVSRERYPNEPIEIAEHYPCLDIRYLVRTGYFDFPTNWPVKVDWSDRTDRPEDSGLLVIVAQNPDFGRVEFFHGPDLSPRHRIDISVAGRRGGSYTFRCPVTQKSCRTLYLRFGRWASREAQRLVNQSQRAERPQTPTADVEPSS